MLTSEREMVRKLDRDDKAGGVDVDKFTSLQPTYEDTVPPDAEDDWDLGD